MKKRKGFSINDVTIIGREKHSLGSDWECFAIDTGEYPIIKFSMGIKDKEGNWGEAKLHDTFNADEATVYSALR